VLPQACKVAEIKGPLQRLKRQCGFGESAEPVAR
jgi:hypothetical protein